LIILQRPIKCQSRLLRRSILSLLLFYIFFLNTILAEDKIFTIKDFQKQFELIKKLEKDFYNSKNISQIGEFHKLVDIANEIGMPKDKLESHWLLGRAYEYTGNLESALEEYAMAIQLYTPDMDQELILRLYVSNTHSLNLMGLHQESYDMASKGLSIAKENKISNIIHPLTVNKAEAALPLGNLEEAEFLLNESLTFAINKENIRYRLTSMNNLGMIYKYTQRVDQSLKMFTNLLEKGRIYKRNKFVVFALLELGDIHRTLKNTEQSQTYLTEALDLSIKSQNNEWLMYSYQYLSNLALAQEDHEQALSYYKNEQQHYKKIFSEKSQQKLATLQHSMETLNKNNQIAILEKEQRIKDIQLKSNRLISILVSIFSILLIIALYFVYRQYKGQIKAKKELQAFQANISHDIRTPLAVLKSHIRAFIDGVRQPNTAAFVKLENRVDDLNKLLTDLYDLSRNKYDLSGSPKEKVLLLELLEDVVDSFDDNFKQNNLLIEQNFKLSSVCSILGNEDHLRQLLNNLFVNSRRYTNENGKLIISALKTRNNILITLEDSPPGVLDGDLSHLFDQLFQAESSRTRTNKGSGLGLAICQSIMTAHKGKIKAAHSTLGGLKITLSFPCQD